MIGPTRLRVLAVAALLSGAVAWAGVRIVYAHGGDLPFVPWTVPAALAAWAALVVALAANLRRRLSGDPGLRPFPPLMAARLLAVAKASAYAGALLAGMYGGFALVLLPDREMFATSRLVVTLLSSVAALAVAVAGLVLERCCRVKPPEDEQPLPSA